jgi:hypothetical protein
LDEKCNSDDGTTSYEHPEEARLLVSIEDRTITEAYTASQSTENCYGKHRDCQYPI